MLYHNVSVGAIGGNDHQVECVQIRSGTMNLNEYRLADFTVDTQNSGTGGGVPFHCGHTIAGLGNDARIGVSRLALAIGHASVRAVPSIIVTAIWVSFDGVNALKNSSTRSTGV